ncbi:hypothetical protein BDA96_04G076700 [Sorghum bicolor]|uniref:Uncharacterized protein n=1 Tax=Sorghum bicolor TaxID=4558 RepID=A0A921UJH6_SORBI|nr:hypothetical protein BDA96_04G076700 [Sorghum bicolor]
MCLTNRSCRICHACKEDTGADQLAWHLLARSRGGLLGSRIFFQQAHKRQG